jgi:hypothetical protein
VSCATMLPTRAVAGHMHVAPPHIGPSPTEGYPFAG